MKKYDWKNEYNPIRRTAKRLFKVLLEVDGGVKKSNIREIAAAGADTFVAGSAIFNEADYKAVIDDMRSELASL